MRRGVLALVLAFAAPAAAKPDRPPPLSPPALHREPRPRSGAGSVVVIGPATPNRTQPALDDKAREELEQLATRSTGHDRIAALDALTAALEQVEPSDAEIDLVAGEIASLYARVLFEPALATYPYADELIVRAAKAVAPAAEAVAIKALERMLVKFPRSPFLYDARIALAEFAERRDDHRQAKQYLEAVLASHTGVFARYARLRLGWVLHAAKDYKSCVAQLTRLVLDPSDPLIADAAANSIVVAYSHAGRAAFAATLFDHADRSQAAERLRRLAAEYAVRGKPADEAIVLRAAIAREGDPAVSCRDRADLVAAMISTHNRVDAEVAIAELAEAVRFADPSCASAADQAVGKLAFAWHAAPGRANRAQLVRAWTRAAELATTDDRRDIATMNVRALSAERPAR